MAHGVEMYRNNVRQAEVGKPGDQSQGNKAKPACGIQDLVCPGKSGFGLGLISDFRFSHCHDVERKSTVYIDPSDINRALKGDE
jgi:hypothetical protein